MYDFIFYCSDKKVAPGEYILAADIGGTNANFGFFSVINGPKKLQLIFSAHRKSRTIDRFSEAVAELLNEAAEKYQVSVLRSIFAVAGAVIPGINRVRPTNLSIMIDGEEIKLATKLRCVHIVNDFTVINYGLPYVLSSALVLVNNGIPRQHAHRAIIGAGTGLGKSIVIWDTNENRYRSLPSEGGHADFAPQNQLELDFAEFIRDQEQFHCNISWEDVLSGYGIGRMYRFFHGRVHRNKRGEESIPVDRIFADRNRNEQSQLTFELYGKLYARCVKNFALDALALGGIYIAGGIAAKNIPLFQQATFIKEFVNCGKQQALLTDVPVTVIGDYNVSLYGAAAYLYAENVCSGDVE